MRQHPGAILFDLDCTLTDRVASVRAYADLFEARFGTGLSRDQITRVLVEADGFGYRPASRAADIAANLGCGAAGDVGDHWSAHFPECAVGADGLLELLDRILALDIRCALVTNGSSAQHRKLAHLNIADRFDAVVVSETLGIKKPDRRIFDHALTALDVPASAAWFVGDHPKNDIGGAVNSGCRAFWISGVHPWPENLDVEYTCLDRLADLQNYLS